MAINLEQLYQAYLDRSGLKEADFLPMDRAKMKRTFYAGMAQVIYVLEETEKAESKHQAEMMLDDVKLQLVDFFLPVKKTNIFYNDEG